MSAYSSKHWPENGHGYYEASPYRSESSRGANRAFYRQQEPRWFRGEGSPHSPYGGSSREYGRHGEMTEWSPYPAHPGSLENGYREREMYPLQHRGEPPIHARNSPRPNPYDLEDPRLHSRDHSAWNRGSPRGPFHHSPTLDAGRSDLAPHDSHQNSHPLQSGYRGVSSYGHRFREGGGGGFAKRPPLESSRSYPPNSSGQYNGGAYWGEGPEGRYPPQRRHSPHRPLLPTPSDDRLPDSHQRGSRASASSMSPCSNSPDMESPRYSRITASGVLEAHEQHKVPVHSLMERRDKGQLEPMGACSSVLPPKRECPAMRAEERRTVLGGKAEKDRIDGLIPHHQNSGAQDSQVSGRSSSIRDPRLQQNKNIAQGAVLTAPSSASQVLKEHSYFREQLQPDHLTQQKQSGSCYLSSMTKAIPQKTKPAPPTALSEKPQPSSVPLPRMQSEQQATSERVPAPHATSSTPVKESSPVKEISERIKKEPEVAAQIEENVRIALPLGQLDVAKKPDCVENQTTESDSSCLEASKFSLQQLSTSVPVDSLPVAADCYPPSPKLFMGGFELDLDTEPESSGEEEGGVSLGADSFMVHVPNIMLPNHYWGIPVPSADESGLRMSSEGDGSEPLKLSLKKYQANQFQLRNGRVLPACTLAFYASRKSPQISSLSALERSPEAHHRRRSQRLAALATAGEGGEGCTLSDDNSESGGEEGDKHEPPDSDESYHLPNTHSGDCSRVPTDGGLGEDSSAVRSEAAEDPAQQASVGKRKRARRGRRSRFFVHSKRKRLTAPAQEGSTDGQASSFELEHSLSALHTHRRSYQDFKPVILETRSRGESFTLMRRKVMEQEIQQHELERVQTARQGDEEDTEDCYMRGEEMDDCGSVQSATSSSLASRDVDSSTTKSSILEQFSPELVARCKKITTAKSSGDTPLHKVCRTGKYDMARYLLLVEGVSVNAQDHAGWTALHEACSSRNHRIAELLLQCSADANLSATDGTRPIHDAIESGSLDLVQLLLQYGADPLAEFGEKTPVEFARAVGQNEIFRYLKEIVMERQKKQTSPSPQSSVSENHTN